MQLQNIEFHFKQFSLTPKCILLLFILFASVSCSDQVATNDVVPASSAVKIEFRTDIPNRNQGNHSDFNQPTPAKTDSDSTRQQVLSYQTNSLLLSETCPTASTT